VCKLCSLVNLKLLAVRGYNTSPQETSQSHRVEELAHLDNFLGAMRKCQLRIGSFHHHFPDGKPSPTRYGSENRTRTRFLCCNLLLTVVNYDWNTDIETYMQPFRYIGYMTRVSRL